MIRLGVYVAIASVAALGAWQGAVWLREDAVRDFMRDAALAASEARRENAATRDRITEEIDNASIDDLRARAAAGGMFSDPTD